MKHSIFRLVCIFLVCCTCRAASTVAPGSNPATIQKATHYVVIPAGTTIRVRTIDPIDVDVAQAGEKFRGSLDDPIIHNGRVVVPRGAAVTLQAVHVKQSGKFKGKDLIQLKVNSIVVNGSAHPVVTTFRQISSKSEGKSTAKKVLGGAGLGGIIGGIAGGGTGAAIGMAAGGTGGAIISAGGERHLKVPSETRLEFQLVSAARF